MRQAIAEAIVGDDGYGEDETVTRLEARYASLVGKESAVFLPSGVMANQIAVRVLTSPGDVILAGRSQHVVSYEMGASARNSSVQFALVDDTTGTLPIGEVADIIDAEKDHQPHIAMVSIENTHMPSGGTPWLLSQLDELLSVVGSLPVHMDGARLFNAVVATGIPAADYAARATSVMTCLSKGLCAPVGSLLAGSSDLMTQARRERKRLGGSMRQAGFLAAAGLVALDSMIERLSDDHRRALRLADAFATRFPESNYDPATCTTNIVAFDHPLARDLVAQLLELGVAGGTVAPRRARFVTHADIGEEQVDRAVALVEDFRWS